MHTGNVRSARQQHVHGFIGRVEPAVQCPGNAIFFHPALEPDLLGQRLRRWHLIQFHRFR